MRGSIDTIAEENNLEWEYVSGYIYYRGILRYQGSRSVSDQSRLSLTVVRARPNRVLDAIFRPTLYGVTYAEYEYGF